MQISEIIQIILYVLCGGVIATIIVYLFRNERERVIEWLKLATAEAEKEFGHGTGKLKLRKVYSFFIEKFPVLSTIIPFSVFSASVDEALKTLNLWLDTNDNINGYIKKE